MSESALDRLARSCGIEREYTDVWGQAQRASDATRRALLSAMGIEAHDESACERVLEDRRAREWSRVLAPVQVVRESQRTVDIGLRASADSSGPLAWSLTLEDGRRCNGEIDLGRLAVLEEAEVEQKKFRRYTFTLPAPLVLGYHRFEIACASPQAMKPASMRLIVVPDACHRPGAIADEGRAWGFQVQLYALRSRRNWGMGDLTDLKALIELCASSGAGVVALNPLHALFPCNPAHASPYSPSSRLFGNVLYLDVEAIADFAECEIAQNRVREPGFQERLDALRSAELVDYPGVAKVKFQVLEHLHRHFRERHLGQSSARAELFRAYRTRHGEVLRRHCTFEALQEAQRRDDPSAGNWRTWPSYYRSAVSPEVAAFAAVNEEHVEFFEYLQWQFDEQLRAARTHARELGLGVGLQLDLAVSVDGGGAECWAGQDCYAQLASVGAPPDPMNLLGQNWGLPPFNPEHLREAGYAPFIATLRENMRGGALRIDHVMWLMRLFWIPAGASAREGAYVRYPLDDLLGILALESMRNRCLVIGEDLGTVPDEVRQALARLGVLSFRPLIFEREADGAFKAPRDFPRDAVATVSTHDLPTLKGFWRGVDLELRAGLGLFPDETRREAETADRTRDRARLIAALRREGLWPDGPESEGALELSPDLALAVHRFLARTPAKLFLVQLEDVLGQLEQVNLPGTVNEHPNWRRKLTLDLEDLGLDPRMRSLVEALRAERGA